MDDAVLTSMTVKCGMVDNGFAEVDMSLYVPNSNLNDLHNIQGFFITPKTVIVKCQHCGQWCARYTACAHCGAPVD